MSGVVDAGLQAGGPAPVRLGFDIGGTFTDIVVVDAAGRIVVKKTLSLLDTLVAEVLDAMGSARDRSRSDQVAPLVHATTVASNAMLERDFARVGVVTTAGFRDDLELRRLTRPPVFDFDWLRLEPIVPRRRRLEVVERISAEGTTRVPVEMASVDEVCQRLIKEQVEAVAVCFINAHVNGSHESQVRGRISDLLPGIPVSVSHEVLPKIGEYERASTTAVNAALMPIVAKYLTRIEKEFGPYADGLRIMQSNGGLMSRLDAREHPVRMVESGPAAGVLCASVLANRLGLDRVVAFDMGGTTVKACLVVDGDPVEKLDYEVGGEAHGAARFDRGQGYAVGVPSFDIVEAGAGGGSIAWSDDGAIHVGPRSAGAEPGPACYGRGGDRPTVTDANVALGYISPLAIAGDSLRIDRELAIAAIDRLGADLDMDVMDVAEGIHLIANASMMRTIRAVTTERGIDPQDFTLVAFGGSGPVHAVALAQALGMKKVIVPPCSGVFSALGLLVADLRIDTVRSVGTPADELTETTLLSLFDGMLAEVELDHRRRGDIRHQRFAEMRYVGQSGELAIRVPEDDLSGSGLARAFHDEHEALFGYARRTDPVWVSSLRVKTSINDVGRLSFEALAAQLVSDRTPWEQTVRMVHFPGEGTVATPVVPRRALEGRSIAGPLIVEEPDTTIVVAPGWSAGLNELACVVLEPLEPGLGYAGARRDGIGGI